MQFSLNVKKKKYKTHSSNQVYVSGTVVWLHFFTLGDSTNCILQDPQCSWQFVQGKKKALDAAVSVQNIS